jgi:hypothetical protein
MAVERPGQEAAGGFQLLGAGTADERSAAKDGPPPRRRWSVLAVLVALGAGFGLGAAVQAVGAESEPRVVQRLVRASPQCMQALNEADRSLVIAGNMRRHLDEHTRIMNDLFRKRIGAAEALNSGMPSLIDGARESARLDSAMAAYRARMRSCDRGTP